MVCNVVVKLLIHIHRKNVVHKYDYISSNSLHVTTCSVIFEDLFSDELLL